MCTANEWAQVHSLHFFPRKTKRTRLRVLRLSRRKLRPEEQVGKDLLEVKNLKLYIENMRILEENEKLRKKACLLHQEKLALMSEFQRRFSKLNMTLLAKRNLNQD